MPVSARDAGSTGTAASTSVRNVPRHSPPRKRAAPTSVMAHVAAEAPVVSRSTTQNVTSCSGVAEVVDAALRMPAHASERPCSRANRRSELATRPPGRSVGCGRGHPIPLHRLWQPDPLRRRDHPPHPRLPPLHGRAATCGSRTRRCSTRRSTQVTCRWCGTGTAVERSTTRRSAPATTGRRLRRPRGRPERPGRRRPPGGRGGARRRPRRPHGRPVVPPPGPPCGRYLAFAKQTPRSLDAIARVVDADDEFRARVAGAVDEDQVGRAGWLWLARPDGWEGELAALEAESSARADGRGRAARGARRHPQLAAPQAAAGRAEAEAAARRAELEGLRPSWRPSRPRGSAAEARVAELAEQVDGLADDRRRTPSATSRTPRPGWSSGGPQLNAARARIRALEAEPAARRARAGRRHDRARGPAAASGARRCRHAAVDAGAAAVTPSGRSPPAPRSRPPARPRLPAHAPAPAVVAARSPSPPPSSPRSPCGRGGRLAGRRPRRAVAEAARAAPRSGRRRDAGAGAGVRRRRSPWTAGDGRRRRRGRARRVPLRAARRHVRRLGRGGRAPAAGAGRRAGGRRLQRDHDGLARARRRPSSAGGCSPRCPTWPPARRRRSSWCSTGPRSSRSPCRRRAARWCACGSRTRASRPTT